MAHVLVAGFCSVPGPNRAGVQLGHALGALSSRHLVDVLVVRSADQSYVEQYRKTRVLRVPVPQAAPLREQIESYRRALRRQLDGADYDIVYFRDGWAGVPVLERRERHKYRTVFDVARGTPAESPPTDKSLAADLAQDDEACLVGADLLLAPTPAARRHLAARGHADRARLVPPGVDVDRFDWFPPEAVGPPRILYVGQLGPGRGIRLLLRSMVEVVSRTHARLVLVGPLQRDFKDSLRDAIDEFALGRYVDVLGATDNQDMPELIAGAAICVAPTAPALESHPTALYPTKILEYLACRRPVVAPRSTTVSMLIEHERHGLLFTAGDPTDLAAQMLRLLADADLGERLAGVGYALVRRAHTASASRRALRDALRVVERTSSRRPATDPLSMDRERRTDVSVHRPPIAAGVISEPDGYGEGDTVDRDTDSGLFLDPPTLITEAPAGLLESMDALRAPTESGQWVVPSSEPRLVRPPADASTDGDSEGTPVDVAVTRAPSSPVETRFVAGEVDAVTPPDGVIDPDESVFTAVSQLVGGRSDARDVTDHADTED